MDQTQQAQHQMLGGWIDAPEEDRPELERMGVTCISFDKDKRLWNVLVSQGAFGQLDRSWGKFIWGLKPVEMDVARAFFQAIILDACRKHRKITVQYRRPDQYGDHIFRFTGYPVAGPEDFDLHFLGDHSLYHRYEDVVSVVLA